MPNMLQDGLAWLTDQLQDHASLSVTYRRKGDSVSLDATLGNQLLRSTAAGRTKVERTDLDLIIKATDLVLDGATVTPLAGDYVDIVFGSVTKRFQVMPVGDDAPWRFSDPHQTAIRVHCKYAGIVT